MRSIFISSVAMLAAIGAPAISCAADHEATNRFYGGLSLGASRLDQSDNNGSAFKLYGGYQITENFGAEMGFLRLGDVETLTQSAKARAFYTAGTARWQLSDRFSLSGMLGVAYREVSGDDTVGAGNLNRDNTAVIVGFGAQYRLTPRVELTVNADHLADVTEESAASDLVTAGVVFRF
jgi:OOP family OmpA-OmpF porin